MHILVVAVFIGCFEADCFKYVFILEHLMNTKLSQWLKLGGLQGEAREDARAPEAKRGARKGAGKDVPAGSLHFANMKRCPMFHTFFHDIFKKLSAVFQQITYHGLNILKHHLLSNR